MKLRLFLVFGLLLSSCASVFSQGQVDDPTGLLDLVQDSTNIVISEEGTESLEKLDMDSIGLQLEGDSLNTDSVVYKHSRIFVDLFGDDETQVFAYLDTIPVYELPPVPSDLYMFHEIVYDSQHTTPITIAEEMRLAQEYADRPIDANAQWLFDLQKQRRLQNSYVSRFVIEHPDKVKYNINDLPEAPKQYVITSSPDKVTLALKEIKVDDKTNITKEEVVLKSWLKDFTANVKFSQAYVSENWYQGGNSNLNLLGNFELNINLNPNKYPKLLFENRIQYKIGIYSTPQDSIRSYSLSEDQLQLNSKFGVKAVKHWYYTTTLQFKTQFFNNYQQNSRTMTASFLSPGELNLGVGMTYNTKTNKKRININLSINPVSYNLKICRNITDLNPVSFGIEEGKHTANQIGSNIEFKFGWNITPNISWNSGLYAFSDYEYVQADWQNTFNFSINKYLSSQIFLNLRYDSSSIPDPDWHRWQFKEILSFGFAYKI